MKEGYKKYEFGYIPNDWTIKKIGKIYNDLKAGATPSRSNPNYFNGNIPWITSGELKSKYIYNTYEKITEEAVKDTNLRIYPKGTFFIAITGLEAEGTRGSCGINGIEAATNQSCLAFQEKEDINTEFLYYWYNLYGDYIGKKYTQGTKQQSLNNKIVEELNIGFPSKKEQEKIVEILSTVDCQIDDTENLIERYEVLKKGLMQRLLSRGIGYTEFKKSEIGEIPASWEVKKLGDICSLINGKVFKPQEWKEEGIPIIRIQNLNGSDEFNYFEGDIDSKYLVQNNDLLFSWSGSRGTSFGPHIWNGVDGVLNQHIFKVIIKDNISIDRTFFYYNLKYITELIEKEAHGSAGLVHITKGALEKFNVIVPCVEEQIKISKILSSIDNEIEEYKNKKKNLEELKKGLMQQLLTGKIRTI